MDQDLIKQCQDSADKIRRDIIQMTYAAGNVGAHLGGSLSLAEILAALYVGVMKINAADPEWEGRDRLILSKGHAALALYPAMAEAGLVTAQRLEEFKQNGSALSAHPSLNGLSGIEYASGSLGQGLSLGVGVCLALRRKNNTESRVFVVVGDGECNEGSVWEAAASAAHWNLNQLVAIVDMNRLQYDGETETIQNYDSMVQRWRQFGWDTAEVDGHDVSEVLSALKKHTQKPLAIIAHTIKGKGVSFMEGNWRFHNARLSQSQYQQALAELEAVK